jgi:hypothetical protein
MLKRHILVFYHVLYFESAKEQGHHYEVSQQERPVDVEIRFIMHAEQHGYGGASHHLLPKFKLLNFPLESFILVVLPCW